MVPFSEELGFSKLFRDFIYCPEKVASFFPEEDIAIKLGKLARSESHRRLIIEILSRQNKSWKAPVAVLDNIKKFENGKAVAVFAGQQACLLGGPYMILLKALAVVKYARQFEEEYNIPVVPVFWIVADDHDFREISYVDIFDTQGALTRLGIDFDPQRDYPPVGTLEYDDSIGGVTDRLESLLPDNDFKTAALDSIRKYYRPGKSIVDGFAEYMLDMVGHLGLVFFNPYDAKFREMMVPFFKDVVERNESLKDELKKTGENLDRAGYHRQVTKADSAVHLFDHQPHRAALHYEDGKFAAGGKIFTKNELLNRIESRPLDVSYDVITKPLVQSFFFPTVAFVGGPAEVAYYAQLMPLFKLFGLTAPRVISRPSLTLVEARFEKLLGQSGLAFEEAALDMDNVIEQRIKGSFPDEHGRMIKEYTDRVKSGLEEIDRTLSSEDPNLKGVFAQAGKRIDYQLNELRDKIYSLHKKRNKTERERLERLHQNLYPNRGMAERSIAPVYFISRYGKNVIDFVFNKLDIAAVDHQLLMMSEYNG